jgi:fructose-bisphosphate aldolase class I
VIFFYYNYYYLFYLTPITHSHGTCNPKEKKIRNLHASNHKMKFILALALLAGSSEALVAPRGLPSTAARVGAAPVKASLADYSDELRATAKSMTLPGKGLLACDESTGTVGGRLESIGLENTEENRMTWRNLLFTSPGIGDFISGAILYEETLFQDDPNGKPFVDVLKDQNVIPGIKVDMGLRPLIGGGEGENWCTGLDGLLERVCKYYARGARFAKWRTALKVDTSAGMPTQLAIDVAAQDLARYARICQEAGLVPIVEPEILIDGVHDIYTAATIQEKVLTTVYKKLQENGVLLEGSILKPAMVVPGIECPDKSDPAEIARLTVQNLERCVPGVMPGVTFLSGGISEEDASIYLNEINKVPRKTNTALTFSYSRALQSSCLKVWGGKPENVDAAQTQLLARAQANSEANQGQYTPGSQPSDQVSLFVKNYVY